MNHLTGLRCTICGAVYSPDEVDYICPNHGDDGNLDPEYDYAQIQSAINQTGFDSSPGMFRYRALLPLESDAPLPPLTVGDTPLYKSTSLADRFGLAEVWIKDEGRNPTGSLKDRASALLVAKSQSESRDLITTASTGNAAAALAGLSASVGMKSVIFVPASAPEAKVTQLLVYGATVLLVDGTYDDAFDLCLAASREYGWYCRNTGYNPYTAEGKKTVSYEICEELSGQRGKFVAPDRIFVSVGDGNIISGVHKGLKDLLALGWIEQMPKIMGVQAEGSSALYNAWKDDLNPMKMQPITANTIADSISAGMPRDRVRAMNAVRQTEGVYLQVNDDEILSAIPALAQQTGVFAEPAAAAAYAGLLKASQGGMLSSDERVVLLITGNGLKDIRSAQKSVGKAHKIIPTLENVAKALKL